MNRAHDDRNAESRSRLAALVARLSNAELTRPLEDGWTAAAALAHLAFWDRRAAVLLERWERDGVGPSPWDPNVINDAMLPQWRLIPARLAAEDAVAAAAEVDARVAAISDELMAAIREGETLRLDRSHHRGAHLDELEQRFP